GIPSIRGGAAGDRRRDEENRDGRCEGETGGGRGDAAEGDGGEEGRRREGDEERGGPGVAIDGGPRPEGRRLAAEEHGPDDRAGDRRREPGRGGPRRLAPDPRGDGGHHGTSDGEIHRDEKSEKSKSAGHRLNVSTGGIERQAGSDGIDPLCYV